MARICNVGEYLTNSADIFPDKTAFRDVNKGITFSELKNQAYRLAATVNKAAGGKTHQPVAIFLPRSVDCIIAFFAVVYSGNFYSPFDIALPQARIKKMMETLRPAVVITDAANEEKVKEIVSESSVVIIDSAGGADNVLLDRIQKTIIDTDPLYVMFTSGSTGTPKGVVVSHRAMIDYTEAMKETFDFDEHIIFGNQSAFYFDASTREIYGTVKNGCEMVIIPEELFISPDRICTHLTETGVNTISWVPSSLVRVANSGVLETSPPKGLKLVMFSGEVMPAKQLNVWRRNVRGGGVRYANVYGPTEITGTCIYFWVDRELRDDEPVPIGFPYRNTGIIVLNEENRLVNGGETGELCVRGSCLAHGYYGDTEKTAAAFTQNPLNDKYPELIYRTGDLVRYNERRELVFIGRKDNQIQHMGFRVELGEIEAAAMAFPAANNCCAVYDENNTRIILAVTPEDIDKAALYKSMNSLLPRYMMPGRIVTLTELPLNANGKIDRGKVKTNILGNND